MALDEDEPVGETELTEALANEWIDPLLARNLIKRLSTERDELKSDRDEAEAALEGNDSEAFDVLRAVRDWFDNVLLHKRPMSDPRKMLSQVERALQQ